MAEWPVGACCEHSVVEEAADGGLGHGPHLRGVTFRPTQYGALPPLHDAAGQDQRQCINDPRVDARPIGDVAVKTAIGSVFGTEAFPDAPHFASEAPRAANDPRGPIIDEPAANDDLIEENEAAIASMV